MSRIGGKRRRRLVAVIVAVAALATGSAAAAAVLSVGSSQLGSNGAPIASCDSNGFVIDGFTLNGSQQITAVTISDIAPACVSGALTVDLTTAANVSVGTGGPVTVTTSPLTVPIPALPAASLVKHEVIIIVGP